MDNRVLSKIFECKREGVTRNWRKLRNDYRIIMSRKMSWVGMLLISGDEKCILGLGRIAY